MISNEILLPFEELILKKRGGSKTLKTLEENKEMVLYIANDILGLSEEEFRALYSTEFNAKYHITKYVAQLLKLADEEALVGSKRSKDYIFGTLYTGGEKTDMQKEIIRLLNNDDESTKKHLERIKDIKKRDGIIFRYLEWLFDAVMEMDTISKRIQFLSRAKELKFAERIPCFALINTHYFCLLDFYFYNLPRETQYEYYGEYLYARKNIPEGFEVLCFAMEDNPQAMKILKG